MIYTRLNGHLTQLERHEKEGNTGLGTNPTCKDWREVSRSALDAEDTRRQAKWSELSQKVSHDRQKTMDAVQCGALFQAWRRGPAWAKPDSHWTGHTADLLPFRLPVILVLWLVIIKEKRASRICLMIKSKWKQKERVKQVCENRQWSLSSSK